MSTWRQAWRVLGEIRAGIAEWRAGGEPLPVIYLRCDGCGEATAHSVMIRSVYGRLYPDGTSDRVEPPLESRCDACGYLQPRAIGDELPCNTEVACAGRRGLLRRRCGRRLVVPAAALLVTCPWCVHHQAGPGR